MKYELETFEHLVNNFTVFPKLTIGTKGLIKEEKRVLLALNSQLLGPDDSYLQWHFRSLEELIRELLRNNAYARSVSGMRLLLCLCSLYQRLLDYFPELRQAPSGLLVILLRKRFREFSRAIDQLNEYLDSSPYPPELTEIVKIPLRQFVQKQLSGRFNYGSYVYLQHYLKMLSENGITIKGSSVGSKALVYLLIANNLNHPALYTFFCEMVRAEVEEYPGNEIKVLKRYKRELKQLLCECAPCLLPGNLNIRDSLVSWLTEEIKNFKNQESNTAVRSAPFKMKMSVPQIACLASLMYNQGVYQEQDPNLVIRHFVGAYSSKETEQMSEASFRNHFKDVSDSAAKGVKRLLTNMLKELEEYPS